MQPAVPAATANPNRILVADAEADARVLYRHTFSDCDVVEAADGRDALVKALVRQPSLVITELRLPLVDGVAFCEILRRDRTTADVPILVVTAEARPSEVQRARRAGADVVLAKPTPLQTLAVEARRLLLQSHDLRGRSAEAQVRAASRVQKSSELLARSEQQRRAILSRSYHRFATTTPPTAPPALNCYSCGRPLKYEQSHIGGVSERHLEQWDYVSCSNCGVFEYRHRTRKLRPLRNDEAECVKALINHALDNGRDNTPPSDTRYGMS